MEKDWVLVENKFFSEVEKIFGKIDGNGFNVQKFFETVKAKI